MRPPTGEQLEAIRYSRCLLEHHVITLEQHNADVEVILEARGAEEQNRGPPL